MILSRSEAVSVIASSTASERQVDTLISCVMNAAKCQIDIVI